MTRGFSSASGAALTATPSVSVLPMPSITSDGSDFSSTSTAELASAADEDAVSSTTSSASSGTYSKEINRF